MIFGDSNPSGRTWAEEGQPISESDDSFIRVTFSACQLATMIHVSRKLVNDSVFDMAGSTGNIATPPRRNRGDRNADGSADGSTIEVK